MAYAEREMAPHQMLRLVDAAFRSPCPIAFLDSAVQTFRMIKRHKDATAVALLGCLFAEREIELLMTLWSAWKRGHARTPESVIG